MYAHMNYFYPVFSVPRFSSCYMIMIHGIMVSTVNGKKLHSLQQNQSNKKSGNKVGMAILQNPRDLRRPQFSEKKV